MSDETRNLKNKIEELERELKLKNMALENSPSLVFVTDEENKILAAYGTKEELLVPEDEVINKKFSQFLPKHAATDVSRAIDRAKRTKKVARAEYELDVNGTSKHYSIRVNQGSDEEHYVHVVNDITAKKIAQEELKRSEQQFKTLFETTPVGIIVHDKDTGDIISANPAGMKLYGYESTEEFKKKDMWLDGEYSFEEALKKIQKTTREGPQRFEWKNRKKTGEIFWEDVYLNVATIDGEERVLASSIEITEKKELENERKKNYKELKDANETKEKMFSIIGHDLKSPFNTILGFTQILKEEYEDLTEKERKEFINIAYDSSKKAYGLLEQLLEWSLASQREQNYNPQPLDIRTIINEVYELNASYIQQNEISFSNKIRPNTYIEADKNMLSTTFRNLLSNAMKYTPENGKITVETQENEDMYTVKITDTGTGMSEEIKDRLLQTTKTNPTKGLRGEIGTGLGLDLAKRFIKKHEGTLNLDSEEGAGTTFYVTLPKKQN